MNDVLWVLSGLTHHGWGCICSSGRTACVIFILVFVSYSTHGSCCCICSHRYRVCTAFCFRALL